MEYTSETIFFVLFAVLFCNHSHNPLLVLIFINLKLYGLLEFPMTARYVTLTHG